MTSPILKTNQTPEFISDEEMFNLEEQGLIETPMTQEQPGFLQSLTQSIVKPFAQTVATGASVGRGLFNLGKAGIQASQGDKSKAMQSVLKAAEPVRINLGYAGEYEPIKTAKEAVGTGAQLAATLLPVGRLEKVISVGLGKTGAEGLKRLGIWATSKAISGGAVGALYGGGQALIEDKNAVDVLKQTALSAILGAGTNVAISGAGEALRGGYNALKDMLPERLYQTIYKQAEGDFREYLETTGLKHLQEKNPVLFEQLKQRGRVFVDNSGKVKVNPTLAKEMLESGAWGSIDNQGKYVFSKMMETDQKIYELLKARETPYIIDISKDKKWLNQLLTDLSERYSKSPFKETYNQIEGFKEALKGSKEIDAQTILAMRRFLDGIRNNNSFRDDVKLAGRQADFKEAADILRGKLADEVPGISELMNNYRMWIQGFDSLVNEAVKRGNRGILNLTDILVGGGGVASGAPFAGFGAATAIRGFQQPFSLTGAGQALHRLPELAKTEQVRNLLRIGLLKGTTVPKEQNE